MGDVPLTGAACLGAEGLPLTGRADFSRLPERRMRQKPPLRPPDFRKEGLALPRSA